MASEAFKATREVIHPAPKAFPVSWLDHIPSSVLRARDLASNLISKNRGSIHLLNSIFSITSIVKLNESKARRLSSYPYGGDLAELSKFVFEIFFVDTTTNFGSCNVNFA
jgi:hypothetical protein